MESESNARAVPPKLRLILLWYACGAVGLLLVALVSLMPAPPAVGVGDKTSHLLAYALLSAWFSLLLRKPRGLVVVVLALIAYGMMIEWLQGLTGYRYAEWGDVLANATGCLLGTLAYCRPLRHGFLRMDGRLAAAIRR